MFTRKRTRKGGATERATARRKVGAVVLKKITYMKGTIKMIVVIETKSGRKAYSTDAPAELARKVGGAIVEVL